MNQSIQSSWLKQSEGLSWLELAWLPHPGTNSLIFIATFTRDGGGRLNPEVYKNIQSAILQKNVYYLIRGNFIQQAQTHCQQKKELHHGGKVEGFKLVKSITRLVLNPAGKCTI